MLLNNRAINEEVLFFAFYFLHLLSISCRQKRIGIPRVLIYTNTAMGPEATSIVQSILHLGEMNGFSINVTDTGTAVYR
ncbi:MAG: hypothetical protein WDM78_12155 [Puia sp.]